MKNNTTPDLYNDYNNKVRNNPIREVHIDGVWGSIAQSFNLLKHDHRIHKLRLQDNTEIAIPTKTQGIVFVSVHGGGVLGTEVFGCNRPYIVKENGDYRLLETHEWRSESEVAIKINNPDFKFKKPDDIEQTLSKFLGCTNFLDLRYNLGNNSHKCFSKGVENSKGEKVKIHGRVRAENNEETKQFADSLDHTCFNGKSVEYNDYEFALKVDSVGLNVDYKLGKKGNIANFSEENCHIEFKCGVYLKEDVSYKRRLGLIRFSIHLDDNNIGNVDSNTNAATLKKALVDGLKSFVGNPDNNNFCFGNKTYRRDYVMDKIFRFPELKKDNYNNYAVVEEDASQSNKITIKKDPNSFDYSISQAIAKLTPTGETSSVMSKEVIMKNRLNLAETCIVALAPTKGEGFLNNTYGAILKEFLCNESKQRLHDKISIGLKREDDNKYQVKIGERTIDCINVNGASCEKDLMIELKEFIMNKDKNFYNKLTNKPADRQRLKNCKDHLKEREEEIIMLFSKENLTSVNLSLSIVKPNNYKGKSLNKYEKIIDCSSIESKASVDTIGDHLINEMGL